MRLRPSREAAYPAQITHLQGILERLGIRPQRWLDLIGNFRRWFRTAVGRAAGMRERAATLGRRWLHGVRHAEQAFADRLRVRASEWRISLLSDRARSALQTAVVPFQYRQPPRQIVAQLR